MSREGQPMDCCQCQGIETLFNRREADKKLKAYRKRGPAKTTRLLIEALQGLTRRNAGLTLLDIGGGVGAVQHELLRSGVQQATGVDASAAYVQVAQEEAHRQGHTDRVHAVHANFVDIAPRIPRADIVTLDRVICCFHDMPALVSLSAAKAGALYGLVYPRDTWWVRAWIGSENLYRRATRNPFRAFVHRSGAVDALVQSQGFERRFYKTTGAWQVVVYAR
jgi:magnesium-protoporphyrin O-methyltransferase